MNLSVKPELLKKLTLGMGALGLLLRVLLYATGIDETGLLASGHWASLSLWVLSCLGVLGLLALTRSIRGPEDYALAFPRSIFAGAGAFAAAAAVMVTAVRELGSQPLMTLLSIAAAICLCITGVCRVTGQKPLFLFHGIVCVFFAVRMVTQYRYWNADPQLQDYVFYLGAYIMLMLAAYQHAAFDADMGSHKKLWLMNLLAVYLCITALKSPADSLLMLGCGFWAFSNLTDLRIRRQRHALILEEESPQEEV